MASLETGPHGSIPMPSFYVLRLELDLLQLPGSDNQLIGDAGWNLLRVIGKRKAKKGRNFKPLTNWRWSCCGTCRNYL